MADNKSGASRSSNLGWGKWIDWNSPLVSKIPDPTRAFSLLCITIMVIRHYLRHDDLGATVFGFFLDPYLLFCAAWAAGAWYMAGSSSAHLPIYDQWAAEWYWWNGPLFNMAMDGFCGSFGKIPVVHDSYILLDYRFTTGHPVVWTNGVIELTCHGPLCLWAYYLIVKKDPLRFPVELITASFQLYGMFVFCIAELYEGQVNIPAHDPVGVSGLKFNEYHLTYYWFGFWFCELVWVYVPLIRLVRAFEECREQMKLKKDR